MFDNLLFQNASQLITSDIMQNKLPNSILFSGPSSSGKLTAALELARSVSCVNQNVKGDWLCTCPACLRHKALLSQDLLLLGSRDCTLEIAASKDVLLNAVKNQESYLLAARYLFIRSIRKLTIRFNPILWEDDDKIGKISPIIQDINEILEELDPLRELPEYSKLEKDVDYLLSVCQKLESTYMYDSIPVNQIRHASSWVRYTTYESKKVLIIENAEKMHDSVKNALLKILEEPPENVIYILTTSRRGAILPTILSRVRTYAFVERNAEQQKQIINRIFHNEDDNIGNFLLNYLPISLEVIKQMANDFYSSITNKKMPDIEKLIKSSNSFEPRVLLKSFFEAFYHIVSTQIASSDNAERDALFFEKQNQYLKKIQICYNNITIYNQSITSALESLAIEMLK